MIIPASHAPSTPLRNSASTLGSPVGRIVSLNSTLPSKCNVLPSVQLISTRGPSPQVINSVSVGAPVDLSSSVPSSTRIVTVTSTNNSAIPVIRRINCQMSNPTPVLHMVNAEPHQTAVGMRPSFPSVVSHTHPTPVIRSNVLSGLRLVQPQQSQLGPRISPAQVVRARFLSPSDG